MECRTAASAIALWLLSPFAVLAEEVQDLTWADLKQSRPAACTDFLTNYLGFPDCAQQTLIARLAPQRLAHCSPGEPSLDGLHVRIAGYVHPLEFEFKGVTEFLLLPPLRADCRHPPPPLPDQVIAVTFPDGVDVTLDPVWITGVLKVEPTTSMVLLTSCVVQVLIQFRYCRLLLQPKLH